MENSRKKEFKTFTLHAVLSSALQSYALDVKQPFVYPHCKYVQVTLVLLTNGPKTQE